MGVVNEFLLGFVVSVVFICRALPFDGKVHLFIELSLLTFLTWEDVTGLFGLVIDLIVSI